MLAQLFYTSNRTKNCTDSEIENILAAAERNNPALSVTGLLLYSDTRFVQYVEGEYTSIIQLYDKIKLDERHDKVVLVSLSAIKDRIFPNWHMGSKQIASEQIDYISSIDKEEQKIFDNILQNSTEQGTKIQTLLKKLL